MKNTTAFILLISISSLFSDHNNPSKDMHDRYNTVKPSRDDLTIPLFEFTTPDYRVNQTISQSIRGGNLMIIPAIIVLNAHEPDVDPSFATNLIQSASVIAVGFIGGAILGYDWGTKLNEIKLKNPDFHLRRYTFGQECQFSATNLSNSEIRINNFNYLITYQTFHKNKYLLPTEYRIGLASVDIKFNDLYSKGNETKLYFDFLFNSNQNSFQIHYGCGLGYSWGNYEFVDQDSLTSTFKKDLNGFCFSPFAGITVNLSDYLYFRGEMKYDLSQFYYRLTDLYSDPEFGSLNLGVSLGTYIF